MRHVTRISLSKQIEFIHTGLISIKFSFDFYTKIWWFNKILNFFDVKNDFSAKILLKLLKKRKKTQLKRTTFGSDMIPLTACGWFDVWTANYQNVNDILTSSWNLSISHPNDTHSYKLIHKSVPFELIWFGLVWLWKTMLFHKSNEMAEYYEKLCTKYHKH